VPLVIGGGYIVTPLKTNGSGKPRTLVESVLEMDAAGWSSLLGAGFSGYPTRLRDSLLAVVAGVSHNLLFFFSILFSDIYLIRMLLNILISKYKGACLLIFNTHDMLLNSISFLCDGY